MCNTTNEYGRDKLKYKNDELEIYNMICETNEDVVDTLYEMYKPLLNRLVNKYYNFYNNLEIDKNDLYQEAMIGFSEALTNYKDNKNASLKTFVQLCVERKIIKALEKSKTKKNKILNESLSLDYDYDSTNLINFVVDNTFEPLHKFSEEEQLEELSTKIEQTLSNNELQVYKLLKDGLKFQEIAKILDKKPKQIDNTIQRIKNKIKKIIGEEKE